MKLRKPPTEYHEHERPYPGDPPRRKDGRCARYPACKEELPAPTAQRRRYGGLAILTEPFCSTECCKLWWQTYV